MSVVESKRKLPVSIYFTPEWWDAAWHSRHPRADVPSQEALEQLFVARQKFLHEEFGDWGIGAAEPAFDHTQIATVMRYGYDLVPALMGTVLQFGDAWEFIPRPRALKDLRDVRPVNIAAHPEGEWLLREKDRLDKLYGHAAHGIDIGSVTNHSFRILGPDFYAELLADREAMCAFFEVLLETMKNLYGFVREHFGGMDPVPVSNCNVSMMGPRLYQDMVRPFDARQCRFGEGHGSNPSRASLHHCDVPADNFLEVYSQLPLDTLQSSIRSDIGLAKKVLPDTKFSALVSPSLLMTADLSDLDRHLDPALQNGVNDLALWNLDPQTSPARVRAVLQRISDTSSRYGRVPEFAAMPLCWEEMEWAHRRYRGATKQSALKDS
jgi:hypothetical protein